jgi:hypothetical protein
MFPVNSPTANLGGSPPKSPSKSRDSSPARRGSNDGQALGVSSGLDASVLDVSVFAGLNVEVLRVGDLGQVSVHADDGNRRDSLLTGTADDSRVNTRRRSGSIGEGGFDGSPRSEMGSPEGAAAALEFGDVISPLKSDVSFLGNGGGGTAQPLGANTFTPLVKAGVLKKSRDSFGSMSIHSETERFLSPETRALYRQTKGNPYDPSARSARYEVSDTQAVAQLFQSVELEIGQAIEYRQGLEDSLKTLQLSVFKKQRALDLLTEQYQEKLAAVESLGADLELLRDASSQQKQSLESVKAELKKKASEKDSLKKLIAALAAQKESLESRVVALTQELGQKEKLDLAEAIALNRTELESEYQDRFAQLLAAQTEGQSIAISQQRELADKDRRIEEGDQALEEEKANCERARAGLAEQRETIRELKNENQSLHAQLSEFKAKLEAMTRQVSVLSGKPAPVVAASVLQHQPKASFDESGVHVYPKGTKDPGDYQTVEYAPDGEHRSGARTPKAGAKARRNSGGAPSSSIPNARTPGKADGKQKTANAMASVLDAI